MKQNDENSTNFDSVQNLKSTPTVEINQERVETQDFEQNQTVEVSATVDDEKIVVDAIDSTVASLNDAGDDGGQNNQPAEDAGGDNDDITYDQAAISVNEIGKLNREFVL